MTSDANIQSGSLKIAVTGTHGMVGGKLVKELKHKGHTVYKLVRKASSDDSEIVWDPQAGELPADRLNGLDAIVHLAGENIASGRWTDEKKKQLRESRIKSTELIAKTLAKLTDPPKTFICASAIGYYGDTGSREVAEGDSKGSGFLADLCGEWEAACQSAKEKGVRVVNLRFGIILSKNGGALGKMLLPFQIGIGGNIGSGKQYMSWVDLDDVTGAICHAITTATVEGPVNVVAPNAVTNAEFTKALGRVLKRPTLCPVPDFAAKLAFGEMADEMLLSSCRVLPGKLEKSQYKFRYTIVDDSLRHAISE